MATGEGLKEKCEDNNNNNTEKKIEKVLNKVKGPAPAIYSGCKAIIPSVVHEEVSPGTQTVKNFYLGTCVSPETAWRISIGLTIF